MEELDIEVNEVSKSDEIDDTNMLNNSGSDGCGSRNDSDSEPPTK